MFLTIRRLMKEASGDILAGTLYGIFLAAIMLLSIIKIAGR